MNEYDKKIKEIKEIEEKTLLELSRIREKRDRAISDYIASLKKEKIEEIKKNIDQSF